jgi:hypothetical protein
MDPAGAVVASLEFKGSRGLLTNHRYLILALKVPKVLFEVSWSTFSRTSESCNNHFVPRRTNLATMQGSGRACDNHHPIAGSRSGPRPNTLLFLGKCQYFPGIGMMCSKAKDRKDLAMDVAPNAGDCRLRHSSGSFPHPKIGFQSERRIFEA